MKLLLRTILIAILALQAIASTVHAFAQELGHVHTPSGHSHSHDQDHGPDHDAKSSDAVDLHEHSCISHCHVSVALLGSALPTPPIANARSFIYRAHAYTEKFTEPIERPQWLAARV